MDPLEREDEKLALARLLDQARDGRGGTVLIEGPAGIGKSRLVEYVRTLAKERGFGRLYGIGDEAEQALPWGVVRQLVDRYAMRYAGPARAVALAGTAERALATLDAAPDGSDPRDAAALARTLHALWWLTVDLAAARPVLIAVDDAQWSDASSLRFLSYLTRRMSDLPVALVVATRPPSGSGGPLVELTAGRIGVRLTPRPLTRAAIGELAVRRGGAARPEVIAALQQASGGNPLFAGQLLDELAGRSLRLDAPGTARHVPQLGPQSVSRSLLAGLSGSASALAAAAAVLGGHSDMGVATELAGLGAIAGAVAVDELVAGHVLAAPSASLSVSESTLSASQPAGPPERPGAAELVFTHPVVRESVLATLLPGRRAEMHARAAALLHERGALAALVAAHLVQAPVGSLAEEDAILRRAAHDLVAGGDEATACGLLARALRGRAYDLDLRADLGRALLAADDAVAARGHLVAAGAGPDPGLEQCRRLADAASATLTLEGPGAAAAELENLLDGPGAVTDPAARMFLEARLAAFSQYTAEESERSGRRLRQFADLPGDSPDERTLLAALAHRLYYAAEGDGPGAGGGADRVAGLIGRALGGGRFFAESSDPVPWCLAMLALGYCDRVEAVRAELDRARASRRGPASPMEYAFFGFMSGATSWRAGDVRLAERDVTASLDALSPEDSDMVTMSLSASCTHLAVLAILERGDPVMAAGLLRRFDDRWPAPAPVLSIVRLQLARVAEALARDEPLESLRLARVLAEADARSGADNPSISWRPYAVLSLLRLGDESAAAELAREQLARARNWGAASDVGAALRLRARTDPDRRADLLDEAVAVLRTAANRVQYAWALADLGEFYRVTRRRTEAREVLRQAAELALVCGSGVLQVRLVDALAALGDRPRSMMFTGLESLTASERRVADLAGAGRSNRDIAQDLFVSPKTVENHLGRVYVKLGIGGRRDLAHVLA